MLKITANLAKRQNSQQSPKFTAFMNLWYSSSRSDLSSLLPCHTSCLCAGNLNADETVQGYEVYSSTIADVLSEPSLHTPITVGLFARWGSGKSFLIGRLRSTLAILSRLRFMLWPVVCIAVQCLSNCLTDWVFDWQCLMLGFGWNTMAL